MSRTRNGDLGATTHRGRYAPEKKLESPTLLGVNRGFGTITEARAHMNHLKENVEIGDDIVLNGQLMQRQPLLPGSDYGHYDSVPRLRVGFGPGRYNESISISQLKSGMHVLELPEE